VSDELQIYISISSQALYLIENNSISKTYTISSAKAGTGNLSGSYKTPLGKHCISEKIGDNAPLATIFKARKNTHTLAKILTKPDERSDTDNITTRILWLRGMEDGINKGGNVDSHNRYIYIHGTDEEGRLGQAVSRGCIRMANQDIVDLYERVTVGTPVEIIP
jgi:hypothetical protein